MIKNENDNDYYNEKESALNTNNYNKNGMNKHNINCNKPNSIEILKNNALSSIVNLTNNILQQEIDLMNANEMNRRSQMNQSSIINNKREIISHQNTICYQCHITPIKGELFKCSQCPEYTLCSQCEENNYESQMHPHNFIFIRQRKERKIESNEFTLLSLNNTIIDQNNLSVKLLNDSLEYKYYRNVDDYYISLTLLNDGDCKWPRPTLLVSDITYSTIASNPEVIKPIMDKGDECNIKLYCFNCLLGIQQMRLLLIHELTNKVIGKPMDIRIKVVDLADINNHSHDNHYNGYNDII